MAGTFTLQHVRLKTGKKDLTAAYRALPQPKTKDMVSDHFFSNSPPTVFVGSKLKYPTVNVGIMAPPVHVEDAAIYDSHERWVAEKTVIQDILRYRGNLINSRFQSTVHAARGKMSGKFLDVSQEVSMAKRAVDMEFHLHKRVKLSLKTDKVTKPHGANAALRNVQLTENTPIGRSVDKVHSDTDLKAGEALKYLYKKNIADQQLSQILSLGTLGLGKNRRLVPTRWSITTVDDAIAKQLIKEVKDCSCVNDHQLFFGNFLGNYYLVMLFPDVFSFELFEMYLPGSSWNPGNQITVSTDSEGYHGRKTYAHNCAGGYYAARLPLLEYLRRNKRQASALVLRFETPDYWAGLGVWVVREAMRKTMFLRAMTFPDQKSMLAMGKTIIGDELGFDVDVLLQRSTLLQSVNTQMKLTQFV